MRRPAPITSYEYLLLAEAVEKSAAVMPGIAAAGRKLDCHVGAMTVTLAPSGRYGGAGYRAG